MKRSSKILSAVSLLSAAGVLAAVATTREVRAGNGCKKMKGTYSATFTTNSCTSPAGLCAPGTITGGPLDGASTQWTELNQASSAGMPTTEPSAVVSYDATLDIVTADGTLSLHDLGVVSAANYPDSLFTEIEVPVSGTGKYAGATGMIYISGALTNNGTAFAGDLSGQICTP
jgi:hypothetical protein